MKTLILLLTILSTAHLFGQCIDEAGFYPINGTFSISSKDQYMILSNGAFIDNSDPTSPSLVGQLSLNGFASSIVTEGNYAYFGTGMTNDLFIADIQNISFPFVKGSINFEIGNGVFGMAMQNNLLLAALGGDGILFSIDVSDKNNPQVLDTLYFDGGQCRDVAVNGDYAFAASEGGLKIIDVSDAENMVPITSIGSGYNSIALGDNYAFLGKSMGGVDVFSVADVFNPAPAFSIPNNFGTAWDLTFRDNLLYLATDFGGLFVYKIENNSAEEMADYHKNGNGQSFGVCLQDSLILLPGLVEGVSLLMYDSAGFVGINSTIVNADLILFPNPSNSIITIRSNHSDLISEIEIFTIEGKKVISKAINKLNFQVDVSNLDPGKYILRAMAENKTFTKLFFKIE